METSATIKKFHSFFSSQRDSPILHAIYPNRSSIFLICVHPPLHSQQKWSIKRDVWSVQGRGDRYKSVFQGYST